MRRRICSALMGLLLVGLTADTTMYPGDKTGPGPVPNLDRLELFDTLPSPFSGF
jgi:hypothetical protein